jgi:hypothetical protein
MRRNRSKRQLRNSTFNSDDSPRSIPSHYVDPITKLVHAFSETSYNKQLLVRLGDAYSLKIDGRLVGRTHIINGPAQSGKTSLVYWALRHDSGETAIITIDCALYRTEMQFIQKLTKEIGESIGVGGLDRRSVASDTIKFS